MFRPETPTVLVDMDGVLADFDKEVLQRLQDRHPHIPIAPQRTNFYVADDYPLHAMLVREISNEEGFFDSLPLVDNALEGWQKIIDLGYRPQICSSPIRANPYSIQEKQGWLKRHFAPVFGIRVVEQAIITKDKHAYDGIALIDDRPKLRDAEKATWQHIIFDRPYNQHSPEPRLFGWKDENLANLLQEAAHRHKP